MNGTFVASRTTSPFSKWIPPGGEAFISRVNQVVADANFTLIAAVIDKARLSQRYANPWSPYDLALHFCMETLLSRLIGLGQEGRLVHVVFESRGKREDRELELSFRRIASNQANAANWA